MGAHLLQSSQPFDVFWIGFLGVQIPSHKGLPKRRALEDDASFEIEDFQMPDVSSSRQHNSITLMESLPRVSLDFLGFPSVFPRFPWIFLYRFPGITLDFP